MFRARWFCKGFLCSSHLTWTLRELNAFSSMAHAYLLPVPSLMNEPGLPGRLASVLESWPPEIVKQKSAHMVGPRAKTNDTTRALMCPMSAVPRLLDSLFAQAPRKAGGRRHLQRWRASDKLPVQLGSALLFFFDEVKDACS